MEGVRLEFLQEITVAASETALREGVGALAFRGYCGKDAMTDVAGKIVVCFGTQRAGLPNGGSGRRMRRRRGRWGW